MTWLSMWRVLPAVAVAILAAIFLRSLSVPRHPPARVSQANTAVQPTPGRPPVQAPIGALKKGKPRRLPQARGEEEATQGGGDLFLLKIRTFPRKHIPRGARARAFAQAQRLRPPRASAAASRAVSDSAQQWTLVGPRPIYDGFAGRVTAIAIDPTNNNTVYIGGAEGGVWKTTDGGTNWTPLTTMKIWPQAASNHDRVKTP